LTEFTGARLHICHVSARVTVDLVRWAKERGVQVTAETCPHYFTLTEAAIDGFDTNCKVNPPCVPRPTAGRLSPAWPTARSTRLPPTTPRT